jgi:hypothetical protein
MKAKFQSPIPKNDRAKEIRVNIYFTDFFQVDPKVLDEYGAFNICLFNDLPLFVDPFLLFDSPKEEYQNLHSQIIGYLRFLRNKSSKGSLDEGHLKAWYRFSEVKQNWLGFSKFGNKGSGLGQDFAFALNENLVKIFANFGQERITKGSHLEKLCLIRDGVGKDNISDFTTNLIKEFLLNYTQTFARKYIRPDLLSNFRVPRTRFNLRTERWESVNFVLPNFGGDYVILTPKDILTKDEIWINREDLVKQFREITNSVENDQLRAELNNYLEQEIPKDATLKERNDVINRAYRRFPELFEYYIRFKEENGNEARAISDNNVEESIQLFIENVKKLVTELYSGTDFYKQIGDTYEEARARIIYMKHVMEDQDGYRLLYRNDEPVKREEYIQLIFKFTWFASPSDFNAEVDNGRGPVDFKASRGAFDKSLIEFKLASNTHLKRNLENQVRIYENANVTRKSLKVIVYFTEEELGKVKRIFEELQILEDDSIILIDARRDNKPSASKA